jgi:hypothetical protein
METKICIECNVEKLFSNFHKQSRSRDGYRNKCKECRKKETSNYYEKYKDIIKQNVSNYKKENSTKVKNSKKNTYLKRRDYYLYKSKHYRKENKEIINEYVKTRRKNDPIFKLKHLMGSRILIFLKSRNIAKTNKTFEIIGCSPEYLKKHLEERFTEGMSWDLMGKYIHIDHIIPLCSAKTEEDVYRLCHYTNLQPLWAEDNLRKSGNY